MGTCDCTLPYRNISRPVVAMAYCTGMRRGEILSLRWESVDLLTRQVRLNAGETKNGGGRLIPLGDELLGALKSQLHLRNTMVPECPLVFFRIIKTKENPVPRWLLSATSEKSGRVLAFRADLPDLSSTTCDGRRSGIWSVQACRNRSL
jgi:integrase